MAFKMKGHTLPGINQRMDKSSKPDGRAKSSAFQKNTDPPKQKRTMSLSDEQTLKDEKNIQVAADTKKEGGYGDRTEEQQAVTEKSRKRQAVIEAQKKSRKELKKETKGSKLKKFFTSTRKLKSDATAKAYRDAKGKRGQAISRENLKNLGGDDYALSPKPKKT